ncbi:hypothetical protein A2U01_0077058, partial [Trifolium medium]|nr:hypothetical protein [Trifolium medium]
VGARIPTVGVFSSFHQIKGIDPGKLVSISAKPNT